MRSVGIVTLFDRILGREMGKQCIAEKQNNSASGIGERVVDLITLRSHFLIWNLAAEVTPKVVSLAYAS